jgi:hypothetical protein
MAGPANGGVNEAALALPPAGPAGRAAEDLIAVAGHPEPGPGVTGIVLRRRPHAGPVRAAVGCRCGPGRASRRLPRSRVHGRARAARGTDRRASPARTWLADWVTQAPRPVSVTAARCPADRSWRSRPAGALNHPGSRYPLGSGRTGRRRPVPRAAAGRPGRASGPASPEPSRRCGRRKRALLGCLYRHRVRSWQDGSRSSRP